MYRLSVRKLSPKRWCYPPPWRVVGAPWPGGRMVSTNVDHHLDVDFWVDCSYTYIHIIPLYKRKNKQLVAHDDLLPTCFRGHSVFFLHVVRGRYWVVELKSDIALLLWKLNPNNFFWLHSLLVIEVSEGPVHVNHYL